MHFCGSTSQRVFGRTQCINHQEPLQAVPIFISHEPNNPPEVPAIKLINLSEIVPPNWRQFKSIIEIVDAEETQKQFGRIKYKLYQKGRCYA